MLANDSLHRLVVHDATWTTLVPARFPHLLALVLTCRRARLRAAIHEHVLDLGLRDEPVIEIVAIGVAALDVSPVSRLADHSMTKIRADDVVRAFDERLVGHRARFVLAFENGHAVWMPGFPMPGRSPVGFLRVCGRCCHGFSSI